MLIPTVDNDGNAFESHHYEAFEALVVARFGGLTLYPGVAAGIWVEGSERFRDDTKVYSIALAGLLAEAPKVLEVVAFAKQFFRQKAIFVTYLGQAEVL